MTTSPSVGRVTDPQNVHATSFVAADTLPNDPYHQGAKLDAHARDIARSVLEGHRDENSARWEIAALVVQSKLAAVQVRRWRRESPNAQTSVDLSELLEDLLMRKIAGEKAVVNLDHLAAGGSISAWLSKMSQSALLSEQRNLLRAKKRQGMLVSPLPNAVGTDSGGQERNTHSLETWAAPVESTTSDELIERDTFESAAFRFASRSKAARPVRITHLQAIALCEGFGVPAPERIDDDKQADQVREALHADPKKASSVVSLILNDEIGQDLSKRPVEQALYDMWRQHPRHILEMLSQADSRIAQTISLSAVTPLPPMDARTLKSLRRRCLTELGTKRGSQALNATITAWAEQSSGMKVSEFYPGKIDASSKSNLKTAAERTAERARFSETVTKLNEAGVTLFGTTAAQVDFELRRRFHHLEEGIEAAEAV